MGRTPKTIDRRAHSVLDPALRLIRVTTALSSDFELKVYIKAGSDEKRALILISEYAGKCTMKGTVPVLDVIVASLASTGIIAGGTPFVA